MRFRGSVKNLSGVRKLWHWIHSRLLVGFLVMTGVVFLVEYDEQDVYREIRVPVSGWIRTAEKFAVSNGWLADGRMAADADRTATDGMAGEDPAVNGAQWAGEVRSGEGIQMTGEQPAEGIQVAGVEQSGGNLETAGGQNTGGTQSGGEELPADGMQPAGDGQNAGETQTVDGQSGTEAETDESGEKEVQYMTVEDDYFADAVFIGDSRTVGMFEYGGIEDITTFYASTGLSIYRIFNAKIIKVEGQRAKITIKEALQDKQFAKIYLMLGINEIGTGDIDGFVRKYAEVLEELKELQPDAIIYVQAIIRVSQKQVQKHDGVDNEEIGERNRRLAELADNERVFFLDVNEVLCDENGDMVREYSSDGVHLKAQYIPLWKEYLLEHAVVIPDPAE